MSCGKHFQQQLLNRLAEIEAAVAARSATPSVAQASVSALGEPDSVSIRLGDFTGDARITGLLITAVEGNTEVSVASGPEPSVWSVPTHSIGVVPGGAQFMNSVNVPCPGSGLSPDTIVSVGNGGGATASVLIFF